jgi:hypothetical protein
MKISELIAELQRFDGNLQVRVEADHGQVAMESYDVSVMHIDSNCYMPDEVEMEYLHEYPDAIKIVVISG